jgi:hypothetical protein
MLQLLLRLLLLLLLWFLRLLPRRRLLLLATTARGRVPAGPCVDSKGVCRTAEFAGKRCQYVSCHMVQA